MKVISDTRYIVGFSEFITTRPWLRRIVEFLLFGKKRYKPAIAWREPFETKHFVIWYSGDKKPPAFRTGTYVVEHCERHFSMIQCMHMGDSMVWFPDNEPRLILSGDTHFGLPGYYPISKNAIPAGAVQV